LVSILSVFRGQKNPPQRIVIAGTDEKLVRGSTLLGNKASLAPTHLEALYRAPCASSTDGVRTRFRSPLSAKAAISEAFPNGRRVPLLPMMAVE